MAKVTIKNSRSQLLFHIVNRQHKSEMRKGSDICHPHVTFNILAQMMAILPYRVWFRTTVIQPLKSCASLPYYHRSKWWGLPIDGNCNPMLITRSPASDLYRFSFSTQKLSERKMLGPFCLLPSPSYVELWDLTFVYNSWFQYKNFLTLIILNVNVPGISLFKRTLSWSQI